MTGNRTIQGAIEAITRHMESLRNNSDGDELYALIARAERKLKRPGEGDVAGLSELHTQLDIYAKDSINLPNMRIRARLLQQHLSAYLPKATQSSATTVAATPIITATSTPDSSVDVADSKRTVARSAKKTAAKQNGSPTTPAVIQGTLERAPQTPTQSAHKDKENYQSLLQSEQDAWQAIYGTVKDYHRLKQAWMDSLNELARNRTALEQQLAQAHEQLTRAEAERDKLATELEQARAQAIQSQPVTTPDIAVHVNAEGPMLVPHAVFVRQISIEIQRIKRFPRPLSLGLLMIDGLAEIGKQYGPAACTNVLTHYAKEILANFRSYDLVSANNEDRFAVLFPDTNKESAARAIEKARKRAAETYVSHEGNSFALPVFVSALVLYSPGEEPDVFLTRAERALEAARSGGKKH